jgi:RHS repeat-associated protein
LSNESSEPVYFDDFKVADTRGRIIEENHYYAFGLRIDGISSKKLDVGIEGSLKNNNLYNDKELFDDADLDWYDYGFRNYDPQIGRFPQLDPLTDKFPELTPYQYASDEPIANVDMDGLEAIGSIVSSSLGEAVVTSSSFMPNIVVQGLKTAKSSASTLSVVGSFFKGAGKDLWGAVKGIGHAVVHLPTTLKNIADLNNPVNSAMAGLAIYRGAQNKIQEFKNGNANTKAEIIGAGAGEILQLFGGEIGEIGKVGEISKAAGISEEIGKATEVAKQSSRIFWSGGDEAMTAAMNYAKSTGGKTLEMTRAGQNLQKLIETRNIAWPEARTMWQRLSKKFAEGTEGTAHFFSGKTVNSGSIWLNTEKPVLLNKGVKIITH